MTAGGQPQTEAYTAAGITLHEWIEQGILVADDASLYIHRMQWQTDTGPRSTIGVIGALALPPDPSAVDVGPADAPSPADVLPHEHTTPKASTDRLELMRSTGANLSPIWVLTPATGFADLLIAATTAPPDAQFTATDGVAHDLWVVSDADRCATIADALTNHPVVVADGHHRLHTAQRYRQELEASGATVGQANRILALVTELVDDSVEVHGIHRLVPQWPGDGNPAQDMAGLFDLEEVDHDEPLVQHLEGAGGMGLITATGRWLARRRPDSTNADVDSQLLASAFDAIGVTGVVFHHDEHFVTEMVRSRHASAAVLVRPPTVDQILAVAHGGERMPPKSTFFAPKPCTGLVLRLINAP